MNNSQATPGATAPMPLQVKNSPISILANLGISANFADLTLSNEQTVEEALALTGRDSNSPLAVVVSPRLGNEYFEQYQVVIVCSLDLGNFRVMENDLINARLEEIVLFNNFRRYCNTGINVIDQMETEVERSLIKIEKELNAAKFKFLSLQETKNKARQLTDDKDWASAVKKLKTDNIIEDIDITGDTIRVTLPFFTVPSDKASTLHFIIPQLTLAIKYYGTTLCAVNVNYARTELNHILKYVLEQQKRLVKKEKETASNPEDYPEIMELSEQFPHPHTFMVGNHNFCWGKNDRRFYLYQTGKQFYDFIVFLKDTLLHIDTGSDPQGVAGAGYFNTIDAQNITALKDKICK